MEVEESRYDKSVPMSKSGSKRAYQEAHFQKDLKVVERALIEIGHQHCIVRPRETIFPHDVYGQRCIGVPQVDRFSCLDGIIEASTQGIDDVLNERGEIVDRSF